MIQKMELVMEKVSPAPPGGSRRSKRPSCSLDFLKIKFVISAVSF
jgi:hypothetical protein